MRYMRVRLSLLVLVLWDADTAWAQVAERVVPSNRVVTFVNVRSSPDTDSGIKAQLQPGQSAELIRAVPMWYEVRLPDGSTGFVSKAWTTVSHGLGPRRDDELRIHYLDIGAGTCTVVQCPGTNAPAIVVDCGSLEPGPNDLSKAEARTYVADLLGQSSVRPNLIISHPDSDHYGYVPDIFDDISFANIWQGGKQSEYTAHGFPQWLVGQQSAGAALHNGFATGWHNDGEPIGASLSCGLASTYVMNVNTEGSKNAQSLVLMIEYGEFSAVFTGDAEGPTEALAIQNFAGNVKASVLTSSHHGASTHRSNSEDWAAATAPEVVIHSSGNRFFHPRCAAMDRFTSVSTTNKHASKCGNSGSYQFFQTTKAHFVTEQVGTVVVTSDGHSPLSLHCRRSNACGVRIPH